MYIFLFIDFQVFTFVSLFTISERSVAKPIKSRIYEK